MRNIFNKCGRIGRLLYLYRDGELSPKEKSLIDKHTRTCPDCSALLKKLQAADGYLEHYRTAYSASTDEEAAINAVLSEITKDEQQRTKHRGQNTRDKIPGIKYQASIAKYRGPLTPFTPILRPALIGTVTLMLCFLSFQQLRDAFRSSALENRLREQIPSYTTDQLDERKETDPLLRKLRGQESRDGLFSSAQTGGVGKNQIYDRLFSLWRRLFEDQNGFLVYLEERYPGLSSINIDDGLTRRERQILSTEGKALIKELEQLTRYGGKQQ